ncbi:MAG: sensor histidine kinase [Thermodesulfobacteriota bacterium]
MTVPAMPAPPESGDTSTTLGPSWKINLLAIGGSILLVLAYSLWQVGQLRGNFHKYARMHAKVVSGVIEQNTKTAILAEDALQQTITTFLANTARFIDYLDAVEPFSGPELDAFAGETGLTAILIIGPAGTRVSTGNGLLVAHACRSGDATLDSVPEKQLYVMNWPRPGGGCILLGFSAVHIEKLHQQLRMPALLEALSALPGIAYVTLADENGGPPVGQIVEQRIRAGGTELRVGFDPGQYTMRVRQIWRNMLLFTLALSVLGIFFSWLLYRYQKTYLRKITDYERRLAREREDAALGRATATITHEIRNPLNAISMGLQRIEIEAEELSREHRALAASMRQAVRRTDAIIGDLLRYTRPVAVRPAAVDPAALLDAVLTLYQPQCREKGIDLRRDIRLPAALVGDGELLGQLFENCIKNAVEAQPDGGYINVTAVADKNNMARVVVENASNQPLPGDPTRFLEPYCTTKTWGTGLGLAIARRIALAHGGGLAVETPDSATFRTIIMLPLDLP